MHNNIFRTSFTTLNEWAKAERAKTPETADEYRKKALSYMFHLPTFKSKAMEEGSELHGKVEAITKETGHMPIDLGGAKLVDCIILPDKTTAPPIIEKKIEVLLLPWLKVVFKCDLLSGVMVTDYKFGTSELSTVVNSGQIEFYGMALTAAKYLVKMGKYCHINQHNGEKESAYIHITNKTITDAYNWTLKHSRNMYNYLLEHKIYEQFDELEEARDE